MGEKRHGDMSQQPVIDHRTNGSRLYLLLACGHERLHNPRVLIPRRAYCDRCCTK